MLILPMKIENGLRDFLWPADAYFLWEKRRALKNFAVQKGVLKNFCAEIFCIGPPPPSSVWESVSNAITKFLGCENMNLLKLFICDS